MNLTTCSNLRLKQFFFCKAHSSYGLGEGWVPVSTELPMLVAPRPSLPDGIVDTKEKYVMIFYSDETEISHPRPDLANLKTFELYRELDAETK